MSNTQAATDQNDDAKLASLRAAIKPFAEAFDLIKDEVHLTGAVIAKEHLCAASTAYLSIDPSPLKHVKGDDWFSQVVSFLVKHDMLDAREEYDVGDVMSALADNYEPASQARLVVTGEMVEAGCAAIMGKRGYIWPASCDEEEQRTARENIRLALSAALATEGKDNG